MYSLILCGGSGTRLWPLSRNNFPKQFLSFDGGNSLIQETYLRMTKIMPPENIFFVTNKANLYNVVNQIKKFNKNFNIDNVLVEPASLNTAPAIAFAVKHLADVKKIDHSDPIIMLPSDHYINDVAEFVRIIKNGLMSVGDHIGTIGIKPTVPKTGYGYIQVGERLGENMYKVVAFKEKPDQQTAEDYLRNGNYLWNGGYYLFNIRSFYREIQMHSPEIYALMTKWYEDFVANFHLMPSISIDYAIAEKSSNIVVFPGSFGWSDIGSFDSLAEVVPSHSDKHVSYESNNVFVHSTSNKLIATIGLDDVVIVENSDSILIHKRGYSEKVKQIVEKLKMEQYKELDNSIQVYRPWGEYHVLVDETMLKVKKIIVYPGTKLSLQSHYHRVEHWVVAKGIAKIVNGDHDVFLKENESTFIPANTVHRLENPGKINLEIIEVQTGHYLEEDDIIRYQDDFIR